MSVSILGTRIDNVGMDDALARVQQLLATGQGHYIVTPNPEILLKAWRDEKLRGILNNSSLSLCDGTGGYLAALLMGKRLKERVAGVDFMQALCAYAAEHDKIVALIGAKEEVRERTKQILQQTYPGLKIFLCGDKGPKIHADIAFVALGSPKQEQWMAREQTRGHFKIMVGVGGAFDMLSGALVRAPKIMRRAGLEWAWRLLLEPRRAGRIASALIVFPLAMIRTLWS